MSPLLRGFYTAASGMISQQRKTDMLTNNMANSNTPGYKVDQSSMRSFPEMLLRRYDSLQGPKENGLRLANRPVVGELSTGVYMQETVPNFLQGDLRETDRNTDVALLDVDMPINEVGIPGATFFMVQNEEGNVRYTRNGTFTLDGNGFLTTSSGLYILDDAGEPISLQNENFRVDETGVLYENDAPVARLGIAYSENPNTLEKEGAGLFSLEGNAVLPLAYDNLEANFRTQQGFIEGSNVDVQRTMTDMLSAYRTFEANQKVLQAYDKSMDKAVNEIGRLN